MHLRPVDLVLRAVVEIAAALGLMVGGWSLAGPPLGPLLAIGLPVGAGFLWATFRVPGDPGPAPSPVSGIARLTLEVALLAAGAVGWLLGGSMLVGIVLAALIVGHLLMTAERIRWLLAHP